jgi:predicted ABC-type sugar transport system permease subunit
VRLDLVFFYRVVICCLENNVQLNYVLKFWSLVIKCMKISTIKVIIDTYFDVSHWRIE